LRAQFGWTERDRQREKQRRKLERRQRRRTMRPARPARPKRPLTHAERVDKLVRRGWSVEVQTDEFTQLVFDHRPVHLFHLVMTVATVGLWAPVWAWTTLLTGQRRKVAR
jgi:hypothetical protein